MNKKLIKIARFLWQHRPRMTPETAKALDFPTYDVIELLGMRWQYPCPQHDEPQPKSHLPKAAGSVRRGMARMDTQTRQGTTRVTAAFEPVTMQITPIGDMKK